MSMSVQLSFTGACAAIGVSDYSTSSMASNAEDDLPLLVPVPVPPLLFEVGLGRSGRGPVWPASPTTVGELHRSLRPVRLLVSHPPCQDKDPTTIYSDSHSRPAEPSASPGRHSRGTKTSSSSSCRGFRCFT
jgi:hypothetical protein